MTILVTPEALRSGEVVVDGASFRHHFRAARHGRGERLRLVDGEGEARWADVVEVGRASARLRVFGPAPGHDPAVEVALFVAPPRPERAAWLVEKVAEIGVRRVVFVTSERAPRQPGAATLARLQRVADAALEQSRGCRRTRVEGVLAWNDAVDATSRIAHCFLLDPNAEGGWTSAGPSCALWVGPEGGWTPRELEALRDAGCAAFHLGPRILRVETAAVVAAALALTPP